MSLELPLIPPPKVPFRPGPPAAWPGMPDPPPGMPVGERPSPDPARVPPADWPRGRGAPWRFPPVTRP